MNLVQVNERLKDMPLRAVQMYANGSNPQVPSYLALAELQRREKISKQADLEKGAADGPMPSIKEQIERKVGLLALQQGRMQQGQQKLGEQATRMPMAVPQNVEPAEEQPQAEDTGIASLPVDESMYEFAGGGIINFAAGGASNITQNLKRRAEAYSEARRREAYEREIAEREARQRREAEGLAAADAAAMGVYPANAQIRQTQPPRPQPPRPQPPRPQPGNQQPPQSGQPPALPPQAPAVAAVSEPPPAQPNTNAEPAKGVTSIFDDPSFMKIVRDSLQQESPQQLFEKQQAQRKMYGLDKRLGEEQERRIQERKAAYEAKRPGGLDDLIRVFGQAAQYKGMSGLAPAYTALQQQRRAEDQRFREEQDKLLDEIEAKRRAESAGLFGSMTETLAKNKDIAARSAGTIAAEQMRAQADFKRQGMSDAAAERLAGIKFDFEERLAKLRLENEKQLKAIPQAQRLSLEEQYVEAQVRAGMPRAKAIEEAKKLGTSVDRIDVEALKASAKTLNDELARINISKERKQQLEAQLDSVNRQLMERSGISSGAPQNKVMTMADVQETARKNNKTVAQVIEAAKQAGYTIR